MLPASTRALTIRYVVVLCRSSRFCRLWRSWRCIMSWSAARSVLRFVQLCDERADACAVQHRLLRQRLTPARPGRRSTTSDRTATDRRPTSSLKERRRLIAPGGPFDARRRDCARRRDHALHRLSHPSGQGQSQDYVALARIIAAVPEGDLAIDDPDVASLQEKNAQRVAGGPQQGGERALATVAAPAHVVMLFGRDRDFRRHPRSR